MKPVYLDYNATTPVDPEVAVEMRPYLDTYFGNPSSIHQFGSDAKKAVEKARLQVANLIECDPAEIIFTSGGSESNNYAIKGVAYNPLNKGKHIICSAIEHPAVYEVCLYLQKQGYKISFIPVDQYGMVSTTDIEKALRKDTILISIMHANNEVGTIQPISKIAEIARKNHILFHTDAAQSAGKIPVNVNDLGVDLLSIAGHKLYAPKGIGALYIRQGVHLEKLIHGANHEQNLRAGTENVLEIVGLGKACEIAREHLFENMEHYRKTSEHLFSRIRKVLPSVKLNGHPENRLPNTVNLSFPNVDANSLVARMEDVAVSAGAACHAESIDVSSVLKAMQVPVEYSMGSIRFSTGRENTIEEIDRACEKVISTVKLLQSDISIEQKKSLSVDKIKLTHFSHGLGCACKIEPANLEKILGSLTLRPDKKLLVGPETSDDAAIYEISDDLAVVQTLDFFAPIVDNPADFGAIAAANALSDIYAMGARPIFAMNIVAFPEKVLPLSVLTEILEGAQEVADEAGISIVGGHSIDDPEPKYGLVVTGTISPKNILRNFGAKPGNKIILTKALGTGIISTAMKKGLASAEISKLSIDSMKMLNRKAAEIIQSYRINACTDVTGFGLLGHLHEMSSSSGCNALLHYNKIPFFSGIEALVAANIIPGGTQKNLKYIDKNVSFGNLSNGRKLMLSDAQTSGGLLIAIESDDAASCIEELMDQGHEYARIIGEFTEKGSGKINVQD